MASNSQQAGERERRELVARQKKWLVERGDTIGKLARGNREWGSQARSIWEAARHESEPLVLLNLLRYQAARNKNWTRPENVVEPLGAAIEECRTVAAKAGDEGLAVELIRHLLVYTIRAYTFFSRPEARQVQGQR